MHTTTIESSRVTTVEGHDDNKCKKRGNKNNTTIQTLDALRIAIAATR